MAKLTDRELHALSILRGKWMNLIPVGEENSGRQASVAVHTEDRMLKALGYPYDPRTGEYRRKDEDNGREQ